MGILETVLIGIGVLLAGAQIYVMGNVTRKRPYRHSVEVTVNRPAERVYPYLTDPELKKQWVGGLQEMVPMNPRGLKVGAKARQVMELDGNHYEVEQEIVDLTPNQRFALALSHPALSAAGTYELFDDGDGHTRLTYTENLVLRDLWLRVMAPAVRRSNLNKLRTDLQRLKRVVEGRPAA